MPKIQHIQTNFTAGELAPSALGRTDLPRYQNGAAIIENALVRVQGGARRRDGLRYVATTKDSTKVSRLFPFVSSPTAAYVIEAGELYLRFYKDGARLGAPYEIVSPYTAAQLVDVTYAQGGETMFLLHPDVAPYRLRRYGDTNWTLDAIPFDPAPAGEIGHSFSVVVTLSSAAVGVGVTATAASAIWLNGDVGRNIIFRGGLFLVTAFTSTTILVGNVVTAFESVTLAADTWTLDGSPQDTVSPGAKDPAETVTTLTSAGLNLWRASDVGKFVRINGGLMKITAFTSTLVVQAQIKQVLLSVVGAPRMSWSLEANLWGTLNGYPRACTLYLQRLILGGTRAFPSTIWGSAVGNYLDYTFTERDADAFAFGLTSSENDSIRHLATARALLVLTNQSEFALRGGTEKPITPTNVQSLNDTSYGANGVRPARIGKELLFVQRAGKKVMSSAYDANDDAYVPDDITVLNETVTGAGLVDMSFAQEPESLLFGVRSDGVVAAATVNGRQEVLAWTRLLTSGTVESTCSIPITAADQTWHIVRRTVGGVNVRMVEVVDPLAKLDAAVIATAAATAVWGGGTHLIGRTVQALADGNYMGTFVVSGAGQITLPRTALAVQFGLAYAWRVKLLTPEFQTGTGTAQGAAMSTSAVAINFLATSHCLVNGDEIPFRAFGASLLDVPITPFTGIHRIETLGWELGASNIELSSDLPFDAHVLAVVRTLTVNDG